MSTRANLTGIIGLHTAGNELTRPEGSLTEALNINVDQRDLATPRRGFNDYGEPTGGVETAASKVKQLFQYKERLFRHYDDKFEYDDNNGSFSPIAGSFYEVIDGLRIKTKESNGNLYITTSAGIKKLSSASSQSIDTDGIEVIDAGVVKANFIEGKVIPTIGGFLPPQSKVAYRYIFGYKDSSGNLILGSPSYRLILTNQAKRTVNSDISKVTINDVNTIDNGDYFLVFTKSKKYVVYFQTDTTVTEPKKADTIGGSYIKVDIQGETVESAVAAILANELSLSIPEFDVTISSLSNDVVELKSNEEGNITDPVNGTGIATTKFEASGVTIGSVVEGSNAVTELTVTIPSGVTTDHFIQVYRSAFISTTTGLTLEDLDPGDELNLVYEYGLSDDDITLGEYTFQDTTPESFRASEVPLYSNGITGEGILQTNDQPPIAQDIELFRNSMFYANTRSKHTLEFNMLSVDDFLSDVTRFVIGNKNITRYYTFSGTIAEYTVTAGTFADTIESSYIMFNSANNKNKYYYWFDKGTGVDPKIDGAIGTRVLITGLVTAQQVIDALYTELLTNNDFLVGTVTNPNGITDPIAANTLKVIYTNNGYTDGLQTATDVYNVDLGTGWNIVEDEEGQGEVAATPEGGNVLLSALVSVGLSIDETAKSLVKIINKDPLSPVNANYLSNSEDLPGKIQLENRSQEDITFYIAVDDPRNDADDPLYDVDVPDIGEEFNPIIPSSRPIQRIQGNGNTTIITLSNHGYSNGDSVFVGYLDDGTGSGSFSGVYILSNVTTNTFEIPVTNSLTVDSDDLITGFPVNNSAVYDPSLKSDNQRAENRIFYSKLNEPEAVPAINFINVGAKDESIVRILSLRDSLFVFKTDGVFIISGTSAPNFSVRQIDNARILAADSAVVLNNQIYCLTEQGVCLVTESGVGIISRGIENLIDSVANLGTQSYKNIFAIPYENDRAYIMFAPKNLNDVTASQAFRYNIFERTWTRWEYEATSGLVLERDNTLYLGNGDRNFTSKERKSDSRHDFCDRQFDRTISAGGVNGKELTISSLVDVNIHDVITQTQTVSISYFNRLLEKMDLFDTTLDAPMSSTFLSSFKAKAGDDISQNIQSLNNHLESLDPTNITTKVITNINKREQMELIIDELNLADAITSIKNYKKPEDVTYEVYITEKDIVYNFITVNIERPFLQDTITIYKHYTKKIQWNVQHYGDPSALKQVSYGTIMFDQNNFNEATARYSSDVKQNLVDVNFKGKGIGYWGDMGWGEPNFYWGGLGNDIPFRTPIPRDKQKCRYLTVEFEHRNARESFRIVGISATIRPISGKAYR